MSLISLIVILIVIGIGLYVINSIIPMDDKIKKILNVIVIVAVCLWLLDVFVGVPTHLGNIRVGK